MSMNRQFAEAVTHRLMQHWGGRLPTWEEFKAAKKAGHVKVNKTVAAEAITWRSVPVSFRYFYGVALPWISFLLVPATLVAWPILGFSGWLVLGSFVGAWFLLKVSREGHCDGISIGAEEDEAFYDLLVRNGAFLFYPDGKRSMQN